MNVPARRIDRRLFGVGCRRSLLSCLTSTRGRGKPPNDLLKSGRTDVSVTNHPTKQANKTGNLLKIAWDLLQGRKGGRTALAILSIPLCRWQWKPPNFNRVNRLAMPEMPVDEHSSVMNYLLHSPWIRRVVLYCIYYTW